MPLIDPLEFRDMFHSVRSVAIVGNAPSILEAQNGALIDSHDLVVRFNRARTAGLEASIGGRTDVLVVNQANSLARSPSPAETVKPKLTICFISPQRDDLRSCSGDAFREWVGPGPLLFSFVPDLIGLGPWARSRPLTSGTYALYVLLRLFDVHKLFVTGFTMFGSVPGGAGKYWQEALPQPSWAHDLDQEGKLFARLLGDFEGELTVTEEVRAVAQRNGIYLPDAATASPRRRPHGRSFRRWAAEALAWRFQSAGVALRRVAESGR